MRPSDFLASIWTAWQVASSLQQAKENAPCTGATFITWGFLMHVVSGIKCDLAIVFLANIWTAWQLASSLQPAKENAPPGEWA
mmetsp:Transcript_148780/g.259481  ORF Transcript_148780/g.259481 Transcript_148780/m.259481 type:complete len:83 (+) Transcript_148780:305-553(+)